MKAPFPWFGGKSRVADVVWRAFGNVPNYVEPFAGSLAVLLGRPHDSKIETCNDVDRYLANFWRAVAAEPLEVARHADWPVNEADLAARHAWLLEQSTFRERMHAEPDFYDVKIAGWWVWGICAWIGTGWCEEPKGNTHPRFDGIGKGVHSNAARARLPSLGNDRGVHGVAAPPCAEWFQQLQTRLRRVRVACGDWQRVLGESTLGKGANVGGRRPCAVFLDPPYAHADRATGVYAEDDASTFALVREWALAHGDDPELRIALCGYEDGFEMPSSWTVHEWKAARGYASAENANRERERIWFSPHCLPLETVQRPLFAEVAR